MKSSPPPINGQASLRSFPSLRITPMPYRVLWRRVLPSSVSVYTTLPHRTLTYFKGESCPYSLAETVVLEKGLYVSPVKKTANQAPSSETNRPPQSPAVSRPRDNSTRRSWDTLHPISPKTSWKSRLRSSLCPQVGPVLSPAGTAVRRMVIRADIDHDYRVQVSIVCLTAR